MNTSTLLAGATAVCLTATAAILAYPKKCAHRPLGIDIKFEPVALRTDGPSLRAALNVDTYRAKRHE